MKNLWLALIWLASGAISSAQDEANILPIVNQNPVGKKACGPCAFLNSLIHGTKADRAVVPQIEGATLTDKVDTLIGRFAQKPSLTYDSPRKLYSAEKGMSKIDYTAFANQALSYYQLPNLKGSYLDRLEDESLRLHLRRIHQLLAFSIQQGTPVVTSIRSFAPEDKGEKFLWQGLSGHFITITAVQETISNHAKGFAFTYLDSYTGTSEEGYIYFDEARNFAANKGNEKDYQWKKNRPFLLITAPSLRLNTHKTSWHLRTIITLDYATYQPQPNP